MAIYKNIHGTTKNEFGIGDTAPIALKTDFGIAQYKNCSSVEPGDIWHNLTYIQDVIYNGKRDKHSLYRLIDSDRPLATFSNEWISNYFNVDEDTNGYNTSWYHSIIRDYILPGQTDANRYLWSIDQTHNYITDVLATPLNIPNKLIRRSQTGGFAAHELFLEEMIGDTKPTLTIGAGTTYDENELGGQIPSEGGISVYKEDGIGFGELAPCASIIKMFAGGGLDEENYHGDFNISREFGIDGKAEINQYGERTLHILNNGIKTLSCTNEHDVFINNKLIVGRSEPPIADLYDRMLTDGTLRLNEDGSLRVTETEYLTNTNDLQLHPTIGATIVMSGGLNYPIGINIERVEDNIQINNGYNFNSVEVNGRSESGYINVNYTTPATSPYNGSLNVKGGLGVRGDLYVAKDLHVYGNIYIHGGQLIELAV